MWLSEGGRGGRQDRNGQLMNKRLGYHTEEFKTHSLCNGELLTRQDSNIMICGWWLEWEEPRVRESVRLSLLTVLAGGSPILGHISITGCMLRSRSLDPIRKDSDWVGLGWREKN